MGVEDDIADRSAALDGCSCRGSGDAAAAVVAAAAAAATATGAASSASRETSRMTSAASAGQVNSTYCRDLSTLMLVGTRRCFTFRCAAKRSARLWVRACCGLILRRGSVTNFSSASHTSSVICETLAATVSLNLLSNDVYGRVAAVRVVTAGKA